MKFGIKGLDWLEDEVNLSRKEFWIVLAGFSPFLIFFMYIFYNGFTLTNYERCLNRETRFRKRSFYGIVDTIVVTQEARRVGCIVFMDGEREYVNTWLLENHDSDIIHGDSLSKTEGNNYIELFTQANPITAIKLFEDECDVLK